MCSPCSSALSSPLGESSTPIFITPLHYSGGGTWQAGEGRAGSVAPPLHPRDAGLGGSDENLLGGWDPGLHCIAQHPLPSHHIAPHRQGAGLRSAPTSSPEEEGGQEEEEEGASSCRLPLAGTHRSPMQLRPGERPRKRPAAGPPRAAGGGGAGQNRGQGAEPPNLAASLKPPAPPL